MLHEGSAVNPKARYVRIAFFLSENITAHRNKMMVNDEQYYQLDVGEFVADVIEGVRDFLREKGASEKYKRNYEKYLRVYPDGLASFASGIPVLA